MIKISPIPKSNLSIGILFLIEHSFPVILSLSICKILSEEQVVALCRYPMASLPSISLTESVFISDPLQKYSLLTSFGKYFFSHGFLIVMVWIISALPSKIIDDMHVFFVYLLLIISL